MEILTKINWVDILAVIILLRISYVAFQEGLSHEIFPFIGAILIISVTYHYYDAIAGYINQNIGWIPLQIASLFAFVILVIGIGFLFKLSKVVIDKIIKVTWHPLIEKFGGLVVGSLRALVTINIVLMILMLMPFSYLKWSVKDRSLTGAYFLRIGPGIHERLSAFLPAISMPAAEKAVMSGPKKAR